MKTIDFNLIKICLTQIKIQNEVILALLCKFLQKEGEPDLYKQVSEIINENLKSSFIDYELEKNI